MPRPRLVALIAVCLMLASAIAFALLAVPARATTYQSPAFHFDGTVANERSATSIVLMDLNKDGLADLAVGAPYNGSSQQGSVSFFLSSGGFPFKNVITVFGWPGDRFGFSLANMGNVSGKGPALAVGAPSASPNGLAQAGNITLFYPSTSFAGNPSAWINSTHAGEELGYALAGAGDVNHDGFDDIVAGAPFCGANANGCAYVFFGGSPQPTAPAMSFTTSTSSAHFGASVAGNGSVDSNSALDIVVGAPDPATTEGAVYIIRNIIGTGSNVNRTTVVAGTANGDRFGASVTMGDFNGDTFSDVAAGAPNGGSGAGYVSVIFGASNFRGSIGTTLTGQAGESLGASVAAGNLHRDLYSDLLVGAPTSTLNATGIGRAYAFYGGSALATSPNLTLVPSAGDNAFGSSVTVGGDYNGDGGPDFAVGDAQFTKGGSTNVGRVYVYAGTIVPTLANPIIHGWVCVPNTWNPSTKKCSGLSGFTVTLVSASPKTAISGSDGSFNFTTSPGTYTINTTKFPYIDNSTAPFTLGFNDVYNVQIFPLKIPRVFGVARDKVNGSAYAGVTVALYNATGVLVNSTVTPASVVYSTYIPTAFIPAVGRSLGLTVKMWDGTHYTNQASMSIARDQSVNVSLDLDRFPVVSGTVLDVSTLVPLSGATVQATQGATVVATTTTNNKGQYSLVALNATVPAPLYFNVTLTKYARGQAFFTANKNQGYSREFDLQSDTIAPTSQITPLLSAYTTTAIVAVSASASDNYPNNVAQVQLFYRFNGTGNFVLYGTDTTAPYTFAFNSTATRGDGKYEFYTIATDYGGNQQAKPVGNMSWTIVDTKAPMSKLAALPTYETVANFTLSATTYDWNPISQLALYYRKGTSGSYALLSADTRAPYSWYFNTTLLGTGDGLYQFYSIATDAAGNVESVPATPDAQTTVDTTGPALTITFPTASQVVGTGYVNVTWTASDPTAGIAKFDVRLDSGAWVHAGTKLYYNFTGVADGSHTVTVNATDNAGNSKLASVSFTVSTVTPTVSISSPAANAIIASASVAVTWSVSNTGAGLATVEVRLDTGTWQSVAVTATTYTFTGVADGSHTLAVRATGLNGAQGSAGVAVTVDGTPPSASITAPAANAWLNTTSVTLTYTASDAGTGLQSVTIAIDGGSPVPVSGGSYTVTLSQGAHTASLTATDNAGNTRTASVSFNVDSTKPVVNISEPAAGAILNSRNVTVTWTASDAGSGVASVRVSLDGGAFQDVGTATTKTFTGLSDGSHTVVVSVRDVAGNVQTASVTFTVPSIVPPPAGGLNPLVIGGGVVVIVIIAAVVAMLLRRRGGKAPAEVPEEETKEETPPPPPGA